MRLLCKVSLYNTGGAPRCRESSSILNGVIKFKQKRYRIMNGWRNCEEFITHDDVIKWKHFPRYWFIVRGIHRWPVNSPHKGQWREALMFSLICARTNGLANIRDAGDSRHKYDIIVLWLCSQHWAAWLIMTSAGAVITNVGSIWISRLNSNTFTKHYSNACLFVISWCSNIWLLSVFYGDTLQI